MEILKSFITNIILFILLSQMMELLLPNSSLQKYSKLVTGLLLVTLMLSPVAQLFHADWFAQLEKGLNFTEMEKNPSLDATIAAKKSEINHNQRAYILEQMAVQLENDAAEELMQRYQVQMVHVQIKMKDSSSELKAENMKEIVVHLQKKTDEGQAVKPVVIDFGAAPQSDDETVEDITTWLTKRWQLGKQHIVVKMDEDDSP